VRRGHDAIAIRRGSASHLGRRASRHGRLGPRAAARPGRRSVLTVGRDELDLREQAAVRRWVARMKPDDANFQLKALPIAIGFRAWIAADAFVRPGFRVGEGAVRFANLIRGLYM